jgi:chitin disaccharide deacetylase
MTSFPSSNPPDRADSSPWADASGAHRSPVLAGDDCQGHQGPAAHAGAACRSVSIAVCLDDVGLHAGVNEAAWRLIDQGHLNTFSAMVGAPAWPEARRAVADLDTTRIDAGLHLDFTEYPLRMPAQPLGVLIRRSFLRQLDVRRLRDEIAAQLDRFIDDVGRWPSHIDGHQHVHQFPQIREALWDILKARGAAQEQPHLWLRSTRRPTCRQDNSHTPALPFKVKAGIIEFLGSRTFCRQAQARGVACSPHLLGVYDFDPTPGRFAQHLPDWLRLASDGDVLMVHPSTQAIPGDAISKARLQEWGFLTSSYWRELLAASGCQLGRVSSSIKT